MTTLILASGSSIRQTLLRQVGVPFEIEVPRIDEDSIRDALLAEEASPRDIADALAEFKARKIADRNPESIVLGCDQVLDFKGEVLSKPASMDDARAQLKRLSGARHKLVSAVVAYKDQKPIWRTVGEVRLMMRPLTPLFIEGYLARTWPGIAESVGAYKLEEEGAALFDRVDGDYFTVLGLPLLPVCGFLRSQGVLPQ